MQSNLTEAYSAVYNQELIDEEYEAELDALVDEDLLEEVVLELLDEGLTEDQIVEAYEELIEARVTSDADRVGGGSKVTSGSGSRMAAASRLDSMKSAKKIANAKARREKVKGAVQKVKDTATNKVNKAKSNIAMGALKATGTKLKGKKGQDLSYSQTMTGHKSVRDKAKAAIKAKAKAKALEAGDKAKEMKDKAVQKASSAAVKGYAAGRAAKQAAGDAVGRAKQSAKNLAARVGRAVSDKKDKVKSAVKSGLGKVARKVADKAGAAASRLGEEVDAYDVILEYLCVEGYAETLEEAEEIMVHLDDETRTGIIEEVSGHHDINA